MLMRRQVRPEPATRRVVGDADAARRLDGAARGAMRRHRRLARPPRQLRCEAAFAALAFMFGGCYGDFGRPRQTILSVDRPGWVSNEAAAALAEPASAYPLTDEERLLREYAYGLIRPPYSRQRWYFILGEFRRVSAIPYYGENYDYQAYVLKLLTEPRRSATSRYAQLIEDIRNDFVRIDQFVPVAFTVVDLDRKREKSLAFVSGLNVDEAANARWRVRENALILAWVQHCLTERAASYRYMLERLIISTPSPKAAEAERLLVELERRIPVMYKGLGIVPADAVTAVVHK
jgi:hypothetical protein